MRQTRVMILLGLFHLSAIGGCGTIANMNGRDVCIQPMPSRPPMPFGGVVGDAKAVGAAVMYAPKEVGRGGLMEATLVGSMFLIDMPFSLVGDVVTLPWAATEFARERAEPTGRYSGWDTSIPGSTPETSGGMKILRKDAEMQRR